MKDEKERKQGVGKKKEKYDETGITERERDNARHYSISVKYILTDSRRPSVEKVVRICGERYCGITRDPR